MKRTSCLSLGMISLMLAGASNAFSANLQDVLSYAYQTNPALLAERENLKATDEQASQAFSGWLPNVSANYGRGHEEVEIGNRNTDKNMTTSRQIALSQPLFKGGATVSQMKRAKHQIKAGRETLANVEQTVLLDAVTAYMDVLQNEELLKISKNNEDVLRRHQTSTQERFDLGEVTRTDVSQAGARISRATSDRIRAEGSLSTARATYKRVIGVDPDTVSMPVPQLNLPATLDEAINIAVEKNPSLNVARYNVMAAEDNISVSKSSILPSASFRGEVNKNNGYSGQGGGEYDTKSAIVNLSIPLYQSGAEYSRVRANKNTYDRRRQDAQDSYNRIVESTIRAWRNLEVAQATIKSTADAVKASEVALEGVSQEAEVGARSTLDVLDAEQELFIAKSDAIRAKRDSIVSMYALKSAIGQLSAQNLNLPVNLYDPKAHYNRTKFKLVGF